MVWKQLLLSLLVLFMWPACDSFYSSGERDNRIVSNDGLRHTSNHDGDHGGGEDGDDSDEDTSEDSGEDGDDSDEDTSNCEDDDVCDEQAALAAFKTNVQPSIDKSCNLCHAHAAGGLTMVKEEDDAAVVAQNRANLQASAQSANAEKLFLKISNQSSAGHGGGDQSDPEKGNLTLAKIEAWLAAEVGCD